jgi:hypothetical protein
MRSLILALAVVGAACDIFEPAEEACVDDATFYLTVRDSITNAPITSGVTGWVKVVATGDSVPLQQRGGTFVDQGTVPGTHQVVLLKEGYERWETTFEVKAASCGAERIDQPVRLAPSAIFTTCSGAPGALGAVRTGQIGKERWTRRGGPHVIRGDVILTDSLIIEPGALICADSSASLVINYSPNNPELTGRLLARGTPTSPIRFTALDPQKPWAGITRSNVQVPSRCCNDGFGVVSNAIIEYARNGVVFGFFVDFERDIHGNFVRQSRVDSTHFRQIRCSAVVAEHLTYSTVDTAGVAEGCDAVVMGIIPRGTVRFEQNIIRGSGRHGVSFRSYGIPTSGGAGGNIILLGGRIEGSRGSGIVFSPFYRDDGVIESRPIRIVDSGLTPVEAPIGIVLDVWPTLSAQDSLLGNARDTVGIWGSLNSGEIVARPGLHWAGRPFGFQTVFSVTYGSDVTVRIEPGGFFSASPDLPVRLNGSLIVSGTPSMPATIGGRLIACNSPTPTISNLRLERAHLEVCSALALDRVRSTNSALLLRGAKLTNAEFEGGFQTSPDGGSLLLRDGARADNVIVRRGFGVSITGANVVLTNCVLTDNIASGVSVFDRLGASPPTNAEIRNCAFENNGGPGIRTFPLPNTNMFVDARLNWWGDPAGPLGPNGDGVTGDVLYEPFLVTRPVITMAGARISR